VGGARGRLPGGLSQTRSDRSDPIESDVRSDPLRWRSAHMLVFILVSIIALPFVLMILASLIKPWLDEANGWEE
jgi:hypothetical protein